MGWNFLIWLRIFWCESKYFDFDLYLSQNILIKVKYLDMGQNIWIWVWAKIFGYGLKYFDVDQNIWMRVKIFRCYSKYFDKVQNILLSLYFVFCNCLYILSFVHIFVFCLSHLYVYVYLYLYATLGPGGLTQPDRLDINQFVANAPVSASSHLQK